MSSPSPDRHFFIVGAQRSGTTYLATVLDEHPEIEMAAPLAPEPKFFLRDDWADLGPEDYRRRFFGRKPGAKRWGEKSTSYSEHEKAGRRIAAWHPGAQLVFLLRHPATRAVSNYYFSRSHGFETLPMADAFAGEERRRDSYDPGKVSASPFAYLQRGRYIDRIRAFERLFEPRQLIVLIYEELVGQLAPIQALYQSLGVEESFVPRAALRTEINPGDKNAGPPAPELWKFLINYFADSIAELETHLERKIPAWDRLAADGFTADFR